MAPVEGRMPASMKFRARCQQVRVSYVAGIESLEAIARTFGPSAPEILQTEIIERLGELRSLWSIDKFAGNDEGKSDRAA